MPTEIDRSFILSEIKRCAEANGGKALGQNQFSRVTGVPEYHWSKYWPRWSEAVAEAGYVRTSSRAASMMSYSWGVGRVHPHVWPDAYDT